MPNFLLGVVGVNKQVADGPVSMFGVVGLCWQSRAAPYDSEFITGYSVCFFP